MKTFKQGDKVKLISLDDMPHSESCNWAVSEGLELGKTYMVTDFEADATKNVVKLGNGLHYFHDAERFELVDLTTDLLEALKDGVKLMEYLINATPTGKVRDTMCDWNIIAQSAINKALNS